MANGLDGTYVYQHPPVVDIKETIRPPVLASCVRGKLLCDQPEGRSSGCRAYFPYVNTVDIRDAQLHVLHTLSNEEMSTVDVFGARV